jgi:Fe-S-cluster-containing dehydrogenase component
MTGKCPGSDGRDVTTVEVECPMCGTLVEFFSDEQRRRCQACGERVERQATPACAAWCPNASSCLGADRYRELLESGALDDVKRP